jgi:predicted MFS family arabinose efflux permease
VIIFVAPAVAMWALLPVIASQHLGLQADGYGALFGALGAGAILGAVLLGRIKNSLSTNAILAGGAALYAAALVLLILVPSFFAALGTLILGTQR